MYVFLKMLCIVSLDLLSITRNTIFYYFLDRCAPCRLEVRQLTYRKQEQHAAALRAQHWADNIAWQTGN